MSLVKLATADIMDQEKYTLTYLGLKQKTAFEITMLSSIALYT